MRFDGYYLLSDHFNIPNLQQRAFDYTRHTLRQLIFNLNEDPPENLPGRVACFFNIYSVSTWLYRFFVFLGIALMVYHFFFKTLGIILMLVEIFYFVAFPIIRELSVWRKQMTRVSSTRSAVLITLTVIFLLILLIPWHSKLTLPAILTARMRQPVYAPFAARIATVPSSDRLYKTGDRLFTLDAEEARFQLRLARIQTEELRKRLKLLPIEAKGLEQAAIWREQLFEREQAARAQVEEIKRLELYAEHDGIMVDMDEGIKPGSYVSPNLLLGTLINSSSTEIEAYADQRATELIKPGTEVTFYSNSKVNKTLKGVVISTDYSRLTTLPTAALADRNGGTIATTTTPDNHLVPKESLYRVRIKLATPLDSARIEVGAVVAKVAPKSLAGRFSRYFLSVLIRESGF
jgi:putative peptide zinc metalloprotease protein